MKQLIFHKEKKKIAGINPKEERKKTQHWDGITIARLFIGLFSVLGSFEYLLHCERRIFWCALGLSFQLNIVLISLLQPHANESHVEHIYMYKVRMIIILLLLFVWSLLHSAHSVHSDHDYSMYLVWHFCLFVFFFSFCRKCKRKTIKIKIQGLNL